MSGLRVAVDHRPLVQAEAVQPGRPGGRRPQQVVHELHRLEPGKQVRAGDGHGAIDARVPGAPEERRRRRAGQAHAEARVPPAQLTGPQAVVGEQEVPHRVRLTAARAVPVRPQEPLGAGGVPFGTLDPF
jgi:hypothetical protein